MDARRTLPAGSPEHTLGFGVVSWMQRWLRSPMDVRRPLALTDEQIRFLLWWYSVTGEGRWVYRRGIMRRPKGWGKDPLAACISLAELLGPVRFDCWGADGEAVGTHAQYAHIQVAGVSADQTRTTTEMLEPLASPALTEAHTLDIGVLRTRALSADGLPVHIRPITASSRSAEGARPTAFVSNETQHWLQTNGGHAMAAVIRRNLAKSPDGSARELAITNAHDPGEDSIASRGEDAWVTQMRAGGGDILLDTVEPILDDRFDLDDDDLLTEALSVAYGDSWWLDMRRIMDECRDPETTPAQAHRFLLNRLVAGDRSWLDPSDLDLAWRDWEVPPAGEPVSVGFDGSRTRDATAMVCTHMETGFQWIAGLWESDLSGEWEVPTREVHEAVERVHDTWRVSRMYCDPAYWEEDVWAWQARWTTEVVAGVWMTGSVRLRAARMMAAYRGAVQRRECLWGGPNTGTRFRAHLLNAVERPIQADAEDGRLHLIGKRSKDSLDCIDAAVAAVLSWQARGDAMASGWRPPVQFSARRRTAKE